MVRGNQFKRNFSIKTEVLKASTICFSFGFLLSIFLTKTCVAGGGLAISSNQISFNHKPGGKDLSIQTNSLWYLDTEASWISFSKLNGKGNSTVQIKVNTNNAVETREGSVIIKAGNSYDTLLVKQIGQPATLVASPSNLQIGRHNKQYEVKVVANIPWKIQHHDDWIHIDKIKSDLLGKVIFTVESSDGKPRSGKISIGAGTTSFDINISQANVVTSNENESILSKLDIYPNPVSDFIIVEGDIDQYQLTNLSGSVILSNEARNHESIRIEMAHLPKGLYLLQLMTPLGTGIKKILVD